MYKISILTACYNKANYIQQCVESILKQTYDNWEMIIVDDFSDDASQHYLASLDDPRITVIRNESRLFCSSSYARALEHATGDICGVVDGDDALHEKAMGILSQAYEQHKNIDHIYTQFIWCNRHLSSSRRGFSTLPDGNGNRSLVDMALKGKHCYSHWRTFRRKLADKGVIFPQGLEVSVDKNMGFTLEELGPGAFLPRPLYFYRYYKGNMSLIQPEQQKETTLKLAKKCRKRRKKHKIKVYPIRKID